MRTPRLIAALALAAPLGACITPHQEAAKLRMPWPAQEQGLVAYASPNADYPTVGGDILKGTAPQTLPETPAPAPPGAPTKP